MRKLSIIISSLVAVALCTIAVQSPVLAAEKFRWPVHGKVVVSFHDENYVFKQLFQHNAIDIAAPQRTTVHVAEDGVVVAVGKPKKRKTDYAYLMVAHANGIATVYGHVSKILVQDGQVVQRGDVIALSGGTPGTRGAGVYSTGPHVHFGVYKNGLPVNPLKYLKQR